MSVEEHRARAGSIKGLRAAVITVSDSRTIATDLSGQRMRAMLESAGVAAPLYHIVPDDASAIRKCLSDCVTRVDVILLTGGTGISPRDNTTDTLASLLEVELRGFGELFRMLSFRQIGSSAMLSRATGGVIQGTLVFALPGSPKAVELGLSELILPELSHLHDQLNKEAK